MNKKVLLAGALLVVPLLAVLAAGFGKDPRAIDSPLVGKPAPAFTLLPLDGGAPVSLATLRGKPAVVNFWATWCQPCQAEHADLVAAAQRWEGRASFLGVVYQDTPEKIRAWLGARGGAYPTLIDQGSAVAIAFGVYGVPETYLLDGQGVIRHKITGPVVPQELDRMLAALAGAP
jgi:cytochrome c biogenesis protein CcmG/thiol:disulfide interchange protein DsbE